jgi:polysaccharide export outer membrane protein
MLIGLAVVLSIALVAAGCAGPLGSLRAGPGPQVAAAPPLAPSPRPDLDNLMYAGGGSAPGSAVVASPIAAVAAVAEAGSVYLLDSGDRLRIVVFGQDGLSNSYIVDAAGNITMPLIGAVPARGTSTSELARVVGTRLRNGFIREPHVAIEIESYRPFFILGEVTYPGQYPYCPQYDGRDRGRDRRRLHATGLSLGCEGRPQPRRSGLPHVGAAHLRVAARRYDHDRRALVLEDRIPPRIKSGAGFFPNMSSPTRHFFTCFFRNSIDRCQASLPAASL